jgi:hypothetical protein
MPGALGISREQWRFAGEWLRPQTLQGKTALSLIAHLLVLFFVFNAWWFGARRLRPAGTKQGTQVMAAYVAGKVAPAREQKRAVATPKRRPVSSVVLKTAPVEEAAAVTAPSADALGDDEVSIARVQGFPSERPDLSGVGQTADLIVDVDVDDTGHVTQVHQRQGIAAQVDAIVMATGEQWVFHPALRGGKPVGSRREIHFHFDRRRNPKDCGWDCFALAAD